MHLTRARIGRGVQPIRIPPGHGISFPYDPLAPVVEPKVMVPAERNPVVDVRVPPVRRPVVDVVHLALRDGGTASDTDAPAVAHGDRYPLGTGEQALMSADVERPLRVVQRDRHRTRIAQVALDDPAGESLPTVFEVPDAAHGGLDAGRLGTVRLGFRQRRRLEHDSHPGLPIAERLPRIGGRTGAKDGDQGVISDLLARPIVGCVDDGSGAGGHGMRIHEPRTPPRTQRRLQNRIDPRRRIVVEHEPPVPLPVLVDPRTERSGGEALLEPQGHPDRVEAIPRDPGGRPQLLDRQMRRLIDQPLDRCRPGAGEEVRIELGIPLDRRLAQPTRIA